MSTPMADGPAMYFGGTIMTFALPLGAFIVVSIALFYLFRSAHSGPRLRYPTTGSFSSVGTREPGPTPAAATAVHDTTAAEAEAVVISQVPLAPEETAASETAEGKAGEE